MATSFIRRYIMAARDCAAWRSRAVPTCTPSSNSRRVPASFDHWERAPEFTAYCALLWPAAAGRHAPRDDPAEIPYARQTRAVGALAEAAFRLAASSYRRIGIVWAGRPTHHNDRNRSTGLARLRIDRDPWDCIRVTAEGRAQGQIGGFGVALRSSISGRSCEISAIRWRFWMLERVVAVVPRSSISAARWARGIGNAAYAPYWRWLLDVPTAPGIRPSRCSPRTGQKLGRVIAGIAKELALPLTAAQVAITVPCRRVPGPSHRPAEFD